MCVCVCTVCAHSLELVLPSPENYYVAVASPVPLLSPGESSTAAAVARHYGAAHLSVDAVVTDVLTNGISPVSLTAKQLYDHAAAERAQKKTTEAGERKNRWRRGGGE